MARITGKSRSTIYKVLKEELGYISTRLVSSYWNGVYIAFLGKSAAFFYQLLKEKKIDWNLFPAAKINRLDLNYI